MALIYLTGPPGAGKTILEKALSKRGFETHDVDDADMGGAHNKLSGELVSIPPAEQRTPQWFDEHEWRIFRSTVEELRRRSADRVIFLCGVTANDADLWPLFDKIVFLTVDKKTLTARIAARTDNDYGKNDFELAEILERRKALEAKYKNQDILVLDASQSPEILVDELLRKIHD